MSFLLTSREPARQSAGLLLLRLVAGGFLLPHGLGKLFGWFDGPGVEGFAAELELFGLPSSPPLPWLLAAWQTALGVLLIAGVFTRLSAWLAAAFLTVTIVVALPQGWFWMHRGAEFPLFWSASLVVIALLGPGAWSFDVWRRRSA